MNPYRKAMEHWVPPECFEARLKERVLAAEPPARRAIRPWSFSRKALLAAAVALAMTATVSAAVLVQWDDIFAGRFGQEAAATPMAESAFQKVDVTSVCGDVALTVREALGDDKTIYLILDYQLPETADAEAVQAAWDSETDQVSCPDVSYYATGDYTWESFQAADGTDWGEIDWADSSSRSGYLSASPLRDCRFSGGSSQRTSSESYDPATRTLTCLLRFTTESVSQSLTEQPLTLLVLPPVMVVGAVETPLAKQPAIVTFQPAYTARAQELEYLDADARYGVRVILSALSIQVEIYGGEYDTLEAPLRDMALVMWDGTEQPLSSLVSGLGASGSRPGNGDFYTSIGFSTHFQELLDLSQVRAVRVGDRELPLSPAG